MIDMQKPTHLLALALASFALVGLTLFFDTEHPALMELRQKVLDENMMAAASKEAMVKRISQLPASYVPALNYFDPCDTYATRKECCSDTSYPVLGGMDLVNYRLTGQVIFGDPKIEAEIQGISRTYKFWFADKTSVSIFESSPEVYLPLWGGFDATEFCTSDVPDVQTLIAATVDISKNFEIDRHISFADLSADQSKSCARSFNNLYGIPMNGIFNTRCVSMSNFRTPTVGLALDMPSGSVPVRMSELYGVPPGIPVGARTIGDELPVSIGTKPEPLNQQDYSSKFQTNEFNEIELPCVGLAGEVPCLIPDKDPDHHHSHDISRPPANVDIVSPSREEYVSPGYSSSGPSPTIDLNSNPQNAARGPATDALEMAAQKPLYAQENIINRSAPVKEPVANPVMEALVGEFPNSEKPLGEKAMLKRGLVDPSQVRDSTRNQLDQITNEGMV